MASESSCMRSSGHRFRRVNSNVGGFPDPAAAWAGADDGAGMVEGGEREDADCPSAPTGRVVDCTQQSGLRGRRLGHDNRDVIGCASFDSRPTRVSFPVMSSAAAAVSEPDVFTQNPYAGRADLSEPEALLLWEYAQTAQLVRDVCACLLLPPVHRALNEASRGRSPRRRTRSSPRPPARSRTRTAARSTTSSRSSSPSSALPCVRPRRALTGPRAPQYKASVWGYLNEQASDDSDRASDNADVTAR
jgi:hypothetical protein